MKFRRVGFALAILLPAGALSAGLALAAMPAGGRAVKPMRLEQTGRVLGQEFGRRIDVNTVNMFVTNIGSFAWDLSSGNSGLIWPKGTNKTAVFASGLWLGCKVGPETRVALSEYSQEYGPGPMVGGTFAPDQADFTVYKVARWSGDPDDTAHVERTPTELAADPLLDPLRHHSWSEYLRGAAPYGAPVRWHHLNPSAPDDSILGPDVLGDQMLWSVYNDADPEVHQNDAGGTTPLGVEIQQTTFAFNRLGPLGNTIFLKFKIINKGTDVLDSMFVSLWSDPDLGGFTDDLVGCDTTLSMGFVYNSNNRDQQYADRPPAVGYDFFLGPTVGGTPLPMTSFNKYINGTDPRDKTEVYNYMLGLYPDGTPVTDPDGVETRFFLAGDPVADTGWLDSNPADRRFLMTSGPITMAPGDTQEVVGAILIAQGSDRLASITGLKFFDKQAQQAFDLDFNLPPPPPLPKVSITQAHGEVRLCWDAASQFGYQAPPGYAFQGYNVYQGASVAGPWKRLFSYDLVDDIKVVRDTVFDATTGQLISDYPVAFGGDNGISHCHAANQDAIRGGPLRDGTEYYFAVTAYAVGLGESPRILENSPAALRVTPQRPALGTDASTARTLCPDFRRVDTGLAGTSDVIELAVVTPAEVTGHTYAVTYASLPQDTVIGADTVRVGWNLTDLNTGVRLLANQVNKSGDDDYQVADGVQVKIVGGYSQSTEFNAANYFGADCPVFAVAEPPFEGVDAGLEGFGGGAGTGWNFFNGLDPAAEADSFTTVEIRFSSTQKQKAYRYLRLQLADGSPPPGGRGYVYAGFEDVGFTAWDVQNEVQLEVGFVERGVTDAAGTLLPDGQQLPPYDHTWMPDESDLGGREYLFISKRGYTGTESVDLAADAAPIIDAKWEYAAWLHRPGDVPADGDVFRWVWGLNPGTANDSIKFATRALVRGNAALARGGLDRVRVVPNPYYTRSRYELDQFNRVVRFINLPEVCTIRIFNLAGEQVQVLQKTDATTSTLDWNLLTENQLPVASGVYIFHVEAPGVGSTFGRMVVFMEKERLNSL